MTILFASLAANTSAFARGEWWIAKPSEPPPVVTLTNEARYIEWKWRTDVTDPKTGVDRFVAGEKLLALSKELEPHEPWCVVKAKCYAWLCDNIAIAVSPLDWYPAVSLWDRYKWPMRPVIWRRNGEIENRFYPALSQRVQEGNQSGLWKTWKDFDHTIPDWDDAIRIGFPGMKKRLRDHWRDKPYYRACDIVADASLRLIRRFADYAKTSPDAASPRMRKEIASLERLATGAPQTAYDVMQFIYLYFVMSEHMEAIQCRSLSIIDKTLWPYYQADLAAGRTTEAEFREQFAHFLWQWGSIDNYWGQPITMGGTKADGTTEYNEVSKILLDILIHLEMQVVFPQLFLQFY